MLTELFCHFTEAGGVTEGKVDNACNRQAHSTPHCTQSQTNHTPIPVHTQSTDETNQDGASCHDDKGAKVGEQKDDLTSMTVKVSNLEQKCMGKSSYEQIVGTQCASNEDSESSMEGEDQSDEVESLGGKGGKQDKTFGITRSENDAGDPSNEAVQEAEKVNLEENPRSKSDSNRIPKGNEQKDNGNGAIPGDKDEKPDQKSGCNYIEKSPSVNENDIDDVSMQEAENENHDQNSELKHTVKRPSGNENDIDEGAMQRAKDEKHDQNNGNKDIGNRPSGKDIDDGAMQGIEVERTRRNEKDTDNKIRPSVENENNGDNDTEKRPIKYEKNDKGDITTQAVKEESPDINKKINNTKKESRENEKKDHPDNGTTKDQDDGTKSISQARNLELSDNATSILGDSDKPFNDSDGGTKESRDKDALPETTPLTQTAQPCNQMENYACHQDEVGATHSQLSHETSSSQSQDDYTILDKQLDRVIDEILTESNLKENIEEWKKSAREKIKNFFQTKVMDGTLSQRSFDPCATKSMPLQIFDSNIHITGKFTLSFPSICYILDTKICRNMFQRK